METVPSLCASGTLGVAAVGLALGHPQHSIAARPTSKKRRMPPQTSLYELQSLQDIAATPPTMTQSASAPTSRLRKRNSGGRPLTSSGYLRDGTRTLVSTPEAKLNHGPEDGGAYRSPVQRSEQTLGHGPFTFEVKDSENTPPGWLKRMSTLSSLKTGSPTPTLRHGSPSVTYSNGSSAPILPHITDPSPSSLSRNKLVKRSSSQRFLKGSSTLHSTLRRPATSHQRSATIQQHYHSDEGSSRPSLAASSILPNGILSEEQPDEGDPQIWLPSFKAQIGGRGKDGVSRKRTGNGFTTRDESIRTIVPDMSEVATLLMATSVSSGSSSEAINGRASDLSRLSRPFTPSNFDNFVSPDVDNARANPDNASELKSRNSFSLGEMFPSPSPSTWKMPRAGSMRKGKPFARTADDRRVVSAPQPGNPSSVTHIGSDQKSPGRILVSRNGTEVPESLSEARVGPFIDEQRGPSSPLPPLHRLSTFEIDIPGNTPSYPTTPQLEDHTSPTREPPTQPTPPMMFPSGQLISKKRSFRFSSAPSEPGSTLLGSDNDNSRLMSGDEDDIDDRSETVYDSTRTGATSSSFSGARRPPIDTIFDESPPSGLPSKSKLIDLQDLLHHNGSFVSPDQRRHHRKIEEQYALTPIRATNPCKEDDSPTPMHNTKEFTFSPEISSTPPLTPVEVKTSDDALRDSDPIPDEELWSFEHAEISRAEAVQIRNISLNGGKNPLTSSPEQSEGSRRHESPLSAGGLEKPTKPNIFEWSEQSITDKESSQGDSPRPKTVHGRQGKDIRGSHMSGRRGPSALHLRSQSVPVQKDMANRRNHNNPSNLDSYVLGHKGPSEDWDGDFDFEESPRTGKQAPPNNDPTHPSLPSGMQVPRNILERQASVHGQFGHVKELALLVEDLKRLQQQAAGQGIIEGQSAELWKEAEGIINLATLDDDEQDVFPPRSPHSPNSEFDLFDEDSPSLGSRRRSGVYSPKEERLRLAEDFSDSQPSSRPSQELSGLETPPPPSSRPRKESSAKAKSVLETIHQQRSHYDAALLDAPFAQKKLPFDTTSLKDLVTRAGVVTRALKEIVRRAENGPETPEPRYSAPRDPPYISQMFHQPPISPTLGKSPRVTQSPKSPKSQRGSTLVGGNITTNDNDINGHMKMMTVV